MRRKKSKSGLKFYGTIVLILFLIYYVLKRVVPKLKLQSIQNTAQFNLPTDDVVVIPVEIVEPLTTQNNLAYNLQVQNCLQQTQNLPEFFNIRSNQYNACMSQS